MSYISYKPWVGKNYHLQDDKIMILMKKIEKPMCGINLNSYANVIEDSLIAYMNDFISHLQIQDDKGLVFISEVLTMQKDDEINREELWSNYACYFPSVMDSIIKSSPKEADEWATQDFFNILQKLQPNKIIVYSKPLFNKLPKPNNIIEYDIQEKYFEITFENVVYNRKIKDSEYAINEYIVNQKSIYALQFLDLTAQRMAFGKLAFLDGRYKLEKYFDDIRELEKQKT